MNNEVYFLLVIANVWAASSKPGNQYVSAMALVAALVVGVAHLVFQK